MMGLDNPIHIAFLLVILLLVFGAKRLPEMGRSLGAGLRGFKESINGESTADPARISPATAMSSATEPATSAPPSPRPSSTPRRCSRQLVSRGLLCSLCSGNPDVPAPARGAQLLAGQLGFPDQAHEGPVEPDRAVLEPA